MSVPWQLDAFLEQIFEQVEGRISIKTRLGMEDPEEFEGLLEIFERYPVAELTIHPRIRTEYYKGTPHRDMFYRVAKRCRLPLCYNGDLWTCKDIDEVVKESKVEALMLGRGLLRHPGLLAEYAGKDWGGTGRVQEFSDRLFEDYTEVMGEHNAMFKMKELWLYLGTYFAASEKEIKPLKKAGDAKEMKQAIRRLLAKSETDRAGVELND